MTKRAICLALVTVCLLDLRGLRAADERAGETSRPATILTGADSQVKEPGYDRAISETEWIALWQRHKGAKEERQYDLYYNPLGLPIIDFEKYMVIAVFESESSNSAGLSAVALRAEQGAIVLTFSDKIYQTAGGVEQVTVYGFFVLPRSKQTVILEEEFPNKETRRFLRRVVARLPYRNADGDLQRSGTAYPNDMP